MAQDTIKQAVYPPVVAVLGHVDHGKTTLLDAIRSTSIAKREHGGITQKIGASSVEILHDGVIRKITFIDTPGHEAFSQMRGRGAVASDIALLIVSSVDGVMPQTRESINILKDSGLPIIVVLTKSDLPTKNPDKVKGQVLREGIMLEGMGGDVPVIEVAATTKHNVKELLDLILLVQELHASGTTSTVSPTNPLKAIVIESRLDQKAGPRATLIIKDGTLTPREDIYTEDGTSRARSVMNDLGKMLATATIGDAVEVLGFLKVPPVGSIVSNQPLIPVDKEVVPPKESVYSPTADQSQIQIILLADSQGSLEAIMHSLPEKINVLEQKSGEVTESDILHAKSTGALVIGFNSTIRPDVAKLARTEKVLAKNYTIIYELLAELADVLEGKRLSEIEEIYGTATILASFPFEKTIVLGVNVVGGRVARGDKIRLVRGDTTVGEAQITSLRVGKTPTNKVEKGHEAGVIVTPMLDFQVGDMLLSHEQYRILMDNQALQKIRDTINGAQAIALAVSKNPSVDQMAAALALYLTLETQGKKVSVVSPTEPIVELSSLVGIDKVKTASEGTSGDLIVSFPYREGEIEKVSYTIDDGLLNIVVKAGETGLTFTQQDVMFKRGSDKPELLITVGVARLADIDSLFPEETLKDVSVVNIDNSSQNDGYGAMVLVSAKFSSLSEQVADLILNLGFDIDVDISQNLLSGITNATSNFQNPQTSYLAFEIAAILLKRGAVREQISVRPSSQQVSQPPFRQRQAHSQPQPVAQPQPQQSQRRGDDRQDRRQAIRDALRAQTQTRQQDRPEEPQSQQVVEQQPRPERPMQNQPQRQSSDQKPPSDWLTPKVYKGSSNV